MSLTASERSQLENNKDKLPASNYDDDYSCDNYDNETTTAGTKRKPTTMTRRTSFSRSWSSYAENYSKSLSGLRRNSSDLLFKRQSTLQSSPSSSSTDLSKSLDSGQLKNLKANAPDSEGKPKSFKISAMHARPFHQRRKSSPVALKFAPTPQSAPKQLKEENGLADILQDCNKDKKTDKICETDEIILSQEQDKTPVSKATENENTSSDNSGKTTSLNTNNLDCIAHKTEQEVDKTKPVEMNKSKYTRDGEESVDNQDEEPAQNRNIYTEIKKNTKWSNSKRFRRRHHTIHADSRRFINPTLVTIAEQSSGSFGSVVSRASERSVGKLTSRRSKSLGDLNTLPDDIKTNGVSVQQLKVGAKSICVSVASNKNKNEETRSKVTKVKYKGEDKSESVAKRYTSRPVQVNIQTFNRMQISSPGVEVQQKPQASRIQPATYAISAQQHAVFTQPKAKWASITISQV